MLENSTIGYLLPGYTIYVPNLKEEKKLKFNKYIPRRGAGKHSPK